MSIGKISSSNISGGKSNSISTEYNFTFPVDFVLVGGGGGGGHDSYTGDSNGRGGSGGSGAALLTSYSSDTNSGQTSRTEPTMQLVKGVSYAVEIGAGGVGGTSANGWGGASGGITIFGNMHCLAGSGGIHQGGGAIDVSTSGGGGAGGVGRAHTGLAPKFMFHPEYGYSGTSGSSTTGFPSGGSGGGGASGGAISGTTGGQGGAGRISTIISDTDATSESVGHVDSGNVYFCGGGSGKGQTGGAASLGGGGNGANARAGSGGNGTANTGGGGGAGSVSGSTGGQGGTGGSGIVILRYATKDVNSYSQTGLTISSVTDGTDTILLIKSGTGSITFS